MCLRCQIKVNASKEHAPTRYFIPCGKCKECEEVYQKGWSFRLRFELEFLARHHWQVGFCTLTYNDAYLPHYPVSVFKDTREYKEVMCFSRDDCERFIRALRSWLWREYRLSGRDACRYMLCSEYGAHTKRSHYHFVIACPPQVDMSRVFVKIHSLWEVNGHVFPRYYLGGRDSHGYMHKPFVVSSAAACAKYISKYTTKDMYYAEHLEACGVKADSFKADMRLYKRCKQFHLQSRSIGSSMLDGLSDAEKLDLIKKGYQFVGDDKLYTIPVYIKNKLIYDNRYIIEEKMVNWYQPKDDADAISFYVQKRLCRRDANRFFIDNYNEIFEHKVSKYKDFFEQTINVEQLRKRGIDNENYIASCGRYYSNTLSFFGISGHEFARIFLATYGVPRRRLGGCVTWSLEWLTHYADLSVYDWPDGSFDLQYTNEELLMIDAVSMVASFLISVWFSVPSDYSEEERLLMRIRDFFGHLE